MSLVEDAQTLDAVNDELQAVASVVADNPQFKTFVEGPSVRTEDKHALVKRVFGEQVHSLMLDYLTLLIDKDRIDHLGASARKFQELVEARRNQVRVRVTTAFPLPIDMEDRLKRGLDASFGRDCILVKSVDERIVGGVVVIVGDRVIDGSIRTGLEEMRQNLMDASL